MLHKLLLLLLDFLFLRLYQLQKLVREREGAYLQHLLQADLLCVQQLHEHFIVERTVNRCI